MAFERFEERVLAMAATSGPDTITGTVGANRIDGLAGDDTIYGHQAEDDSPDAGLIAATRVREGTGSDGTVFAGGAPGDDGFLYVVKKNTGEILRLDVATGDSTLFLAIPTSELTTGGEQGLLALAFHPEYETNGRFFVHIVNADGDLELREYSRSEGDPAVADSGLVQTIITIPHPGEGNHNGGSIAFGPNDGYLYYSLGDGGGGNDPNDNAQNKSSLLGKMLRLDVDGDDFPENADRNYAIPDDNPFVGKAGADEIWAYGLRNPWRWSFDPENGDMYIGDVGQSAREEIDYLRGTHNGGANFGWDIREGTLGPNLPGARDPIHEYGRSFGEAVTGGHVYRGPVDDVDGIYFFADFISSRIWSLKVVNGKATAVTERTDQIFPDEGEIDGISSFGVDNAGNLYVVMLGGDIFRLDVDALSGDAGDRLHGNGGDDSIHGGAGGDRLFGDAGNDALNGGLGDDRLRGGTGQDTLSGDAGADRFVFDKPPVEENMDLIDDFTVGEDTIVLARSVFKKLPGGDELSVAAFNIGEGAEDASDRIIYDDATGDLIYDRNGDLAGGARLIANIGAGLDLDNGDFAIV
jgi:Ca2+-binding RTX toxin-like protein